MNNDFYKCKICGEDIDPSTYELHINKKHLLNYSRYYEYCNLSLSEAECPECRRKLYKLNPWSNLTLPCVHCNNKKDYVRKIAELIQLWENYIISGKYSPLWFSTTYYRDKYIKFNLSDLDRLIDKLRSSDKDSAFDSINLFDISFNEWSSKEISDRNLSNIKLTNSKFIFSKQEFNINKQINGYQFNLGNNTYSILLPEVSEYMNKNYYRNSIYNLKSYNEGKLIRRLKISQSDCIQLYSTINPICKSILRVHKNGEKILPNLLDEYELLSIKYYILRNKSILQYLIDIYNELIKCSIRLKDEVFLLNEILYNPYGSRNINIKWMSDNEISDEYLNISII